MICLGIESTAHTYGIGLVKDDGRILSNVKKTFTTSQGGLIPGDVAEHHIKICDKLIIEALAEAKIKLKDVGLISFSQGPGIGHCLRVGAMVARCLALLHKIPLVGVNHCIAHLEIGKLLTKAKNPVMLYVSGANTQLIAFSMGMYRIFGETLDIGVGNMLDVFARNIGIGFPGGPKIMELAEKGKNYVELPYVVKGMDISLGGILTNVTEKHKSGKFRVEDLCYSLQETVFAMIVEASERALSHTQKAELLIGGGVGCNKRLQEMCEIMCSERGAEFFVPENQFLVDNGSQIAWLGILMYKAGLKTDIKDSAIKPYQRTDDIKVTWA